MCFEADMGPQASGHLLEATDLNDAIRLATKIPPVQRGSIEVRRRGSWMLNDCS